MELKYIKLFEEISAEIGKIKSFVSRESYFELDYETHDHVAFITRENGDVGSETPGPEDIKEANRLKKLIKDKFNVSVGVEEVDEWVYVNVHNYRKNNNE